MKKYLIDGNNLIGKIVLLSNIQKKDKQSSREKLAHLLDRFFSEKKVRAILFFDGYENQKIKTTRIQIVYSDRISADEKIKIQIESEKSTRNAIIVSSDNGIKEFAKVCGCKVISSEEFGSEITKRKSADDEASRIEEMNDIDEFKKIFNA